MGAIAEGIAGFAKPLLDQTDGSIEQVEKAFALSTLCFNLALVSDAERAKVLGDLQSDFKMDDEEFDEFRRAVIVPMIRRHEEMVPLMHRRSAAGLSPSRPTLPAPPATGARTEKYPGTGRYAPCPCDSGKKYKFCRGAKGR
jgi:hypothetical protein